MEAKMCSDVIFQIAGECPELSVLPSNDMVSTEYLCERSTCELRLVTFLRGVQNNGLACAALMPVEYTVVADLPSTIDICIYILYALLLVVTVSQGLDSILRIVSW